MTGLDYASTAFLAVGCFFALTGGVGLVRMPDFYTRLHPAGKSDTLAQVLIMIALAIQAAQSGDWTVVAKLGLLSGLLFVTAPAATHAITRAAQLDGQKPLTDVPLPGEQPADDRADLRDGDRDDETEGGSSKKGGRNV